MASGVSTSLMPVDYAFSVNLLADAAHVSRRRMLSALARNGGDPTAALVSFGEPSASASALALAARVLGPDGQATPSVPPHLVSGRGSSQLHGRHYHYGGEDGLVFWPAAVERNTYLDADEAWEDYASLVPDGGWEIVENIAFRVTTTTRQVRATGRTRQAHRKGWGELSESYKSRLVGAGKRRGMSRAQVYNAYRRGGPQLEELYGKRARTVERKVRQRVELPPSFTVWTSHEDAQGVPIVSPKDKPRRPDQAFDEWMEEEGYEPGTFRRGRLLWVD